MCVGGVGVGWVREPGERRGAVERGKRGGREGRGVVSPFCGPGCGKTLYRASAPALHPYLGHLGAVLGRQRHLGMGCPSLGGRRARAGLRGVHGRDPPAQRALLSHAHCVGRGARARAADGGGGGRSRTLTRGGRRGLERAQLGKEARSSLAQGQEPAGTGAGRPRGGTEGRRRGAGGSALAAPASVLCGEGRAGDSRGGVVRASFYLSPVSGAGKAALACILSQRNGCERLSIN